MDGKPELDRTTEAASVGCVFNIQRYAVHDGPGIRTTVFLKGCPLGCLWCDNPESQSGRQQILFWEDRCIRCDTCLAICPLSAVTVDAQARRQIDFGQCDLCGLCIEQCHARALEGVGALKTVAEVMNIVEQDQPFYDESGGGMTLSGGEPLAQPAFTFHLLQAARLRGIHTAMETSGFASWRVWSRLLPCLDLILYDIKEVDAEQHKYFVGKSNKLILDNLRRLAQTGKPIIIRRPVVRGYNDQPESAHALGRFIHELDTVHEVHLLPYHRLGQKKYERLGRQYVLANAPTMKNEELTEIQDILLSYGLKVKIGG